MLSQLIWADYAILTIIAISALISLVRGFVREALSLAGWVAAVWAAFTFGPRVANLLVDQIAVPSVRQAVATLALFFATLVATGLLVYLVGLLVEKTGISGTDRAFGMLFGVARGALIVGILVLLAGLTPLPLDPWWDQSVLILPFEQLALEVRRFLPPEIAAYFQY